MLLGLILFYVGAVLFCNGLWLMDFISDREIPIINIFVGGITLFAALFLAFGPDADADTIKAAAFTLLFTFTYLWVAINRWNAADGRGLGWFCLFVAITATAVAADLLGDAASLWGFWFGLCWAAWAILWLMYFFLLSLNKQIAKVTGVVTALLGIVTGWLPGYLLLQGIIS